MEYVALKTLALLANILFCQDPCVENPSFSSKSSQWLGSQGQILACPRCRRATPPGPRKRPHPGVAKKLQPTADKDTQ